MRSTFIIAFRDLSSFLKSPIFYVLTAVFLILFNYIFFNILNFFSFQSMQAAQFQGQMGGMGLNLNDMVVQPALHNMGVVLLLMIPLITMRSFSEEKKNKSVNLLLSSPVQLHEIVIGKFLACFLVVTTMISLTLISIGLLFYVGEPELGPIATSYLGMLLMASCYISVGVFASSLTDNQIVAAVMSFGFTLFMWIIGWGAQAAGSDFGDLLKYLSLIDHLDPFFKGMFDVADFAYYLSVIVFGLFLTHRTLDSNRWR